MANTDIDQDAAKPDRSFDEKSFTPIGTMTLMVLYVLIFAAAWAYVYFGSLLARR